jgi:hypothetical protein
MPMYQVFVCDRCGRTVDSRSIADWEGALAPGWSEVIVTSASSVPASGDVEDPADLFPDPDVWLLCEDCAPAAVADLRAYVRAVRPPAN